MTQIAFIHVRDHDEKKNLLSTGGATIAYKFHRMGDALHIFWAAAECLPADARDGKGDRYVKSIGRTIASKRLEESPTGTIILTAAAEDDIEAKVYEDYMLFKEQFMPDVSYWYFPGYIKDGKSVRCGFDLKKYNHAAFETPPEA